jgi:hypothetical protein
VYSDSSEVIQLMCQCRALHLCLQLLLQVQEYSILYDGSNTEYPDCTIGAADSGGSCNVSSVLFCCVSKSLVTLLRGCPGNSESFEIYYQFQLRSTARRGNNGSIILIPF